MGHNESPQTVTKKHCFLEINQDSGSTVTTLLVLVITHSLAEAHNANAFFLWRTILRFCLI